jgi:hypothetical protein
LHPANLLILKFIAFQVQMINVITSLWTALKSL